MSAIQIKKTGNFWIDNGLVGLYRVLESLQSKEVLNDNGNRIDFKVILNSTSLEIKLSGDIPDDGHSVHPDLIKVLNEAKKEVVKNYITSTLNSSWIYNNKQFELYRKSDFKPHLKSFFTGKTPKTEGGLCSWYDKKDITTILNKRNIPHQLEKENIILTDNRYKHKPDRNVILPNFKKEDVKANDRLMSGEEFIDFIHFLEDNSFIKITDESKPVSLTGRGFLNTPPQYEIGEDFSSDFLKKGKKQCSFSGETYLKAEVITGMDYPFLTGKSGEMNFASYLEGKPTISSQYAFVALFSFYNLYYQLQNDLLNYFVFHDNNLKELNSFYNAIQPAISQLKNTDYCNFETYITGTEYENETLFGFIVSVYKQAKQKLAKDARKELYTKSIFTFTNDGNIFRDVKEYTSLTQLFELFDSFDETEDGKFGFESFLNLIRYFYKTIPSKPKPKYDTTWRNRLCADILNFRSIAKTVEWFLAEVRLKEETPSGIFYLDKILHVYNNKTQFDMKPEMVEMCKSVGNRIGRYCREKDDKGILFSIRNAKNRTEFLNVLSESQFRTEVSYGEDFFKALPDTPAWEEYKALVSIFAMNSFLYKPNNPNNSCLSPLFSGRFFQKSLLVKPAHRPARPIGEGRPVQ